MKPFASLKEHLVLLAACWILLQGGAQGQVETILHSFTGGNGSADGNGPYGSLIQATNGNYYGTTRNDGGGGGCVFEITPSGTVTILHSFGVIAEDGYYPTAGLVQGTDGAFFGTTTAGGGNGGGYGTVFKISPQGTYTKLHSFRDGSVTNDGSGPTTSLVEGADGNFYGTTPGGGSAGDGTVYRITPDGVLTILHSFGDGSVTNDGTTPEAPLILGADGNFYGTTNGGSSHDEGTLFKITPQGTETIMHNFGDGSVTNDGSGPTTPLMQGTDGNFYGTTENGGAQSGTLGGSGCVFKMTPQGVVTILHSFDGGTALNDGELPLGGLTQGPDGSIYGMASRGGGRGRSRLYL